MDFGAMIKVAMLLLSKRDEVGKLLDLVREVGGALGEGPPATPPTLAPGGHPVGSMAWLQDSLNTLSNAGLEVDGDYGPATNRAVCEFQKANGLAVDGWAGPETVAAIMKALES
jgi:peptidoglycan hydrolase-like protein with peptidoglycan-binding domain